MKKTFQLGGVSCQVCVNKIEKKMKKADGVIECTVNLATGKMQINFDDKIIDVKKIIEIVEKLGYNVEEQLETKTIILEIENISCQVCVNKIEKKLLKVEGVQKISANLATKKGTVTYEPSKIKISEILDILEKMSYKARKYDVTTENVKVESKNFSLEIALLFSFFIFYISMGSMMGLPIPKIISPHFNPFKFAIIQLVLTIPVVYIGRKFYINGTKQLLLKSPNMDSLIGIGTGSAILYSLYATYKIYMGEIHFVHSLYYESGVVILGLILLGKVLEERSKGKTSEAIKKLMGLKSNKATLIKDGEYLQVDVDDVVTGDRLLIKSGEIIPVDATIEKGNCSVDESMLTGESLPLLKKEGDKVFGATINKNGTIEVIAEAVGEDTVLAKIIKIVEEAQGSKAPIAKIADKISGYFVPVVMSIAILSGGIWYIVGKYQIFEIKEPLTFALTIFISVLVIACPCSLGLATPTAIMVGTGKGAELGILIKSGEALEKAGKVNTILFDKTGTLTKGEPTVIDIVSDKIEEDELLMLVASLEQYSEHLLGIAIIEEAKKRALKQKRVENFKSITGKGIFGDIEGKRIVVGNTQLLIDENIEIEKIFEERAIFFAKEGKTPLFVALDGECIGIITVADILKDESVKVVAKLKEKGYKVGMITGDNRVTAESIAKKINVDFVLSEVSPEEKYLKVKEFQNKKRVVAMVGDGINDSPALTQADVGIAIGNGTDIAIESADIVLMKKNLQDIIVTFNLSKEVIKTIKQNLFWAFIYNVIGIPVASGVLYPFTGHLLNPMIAGGAMAMSSISVVTNALRLRKFKYEKE